MNHCVICEKPLGVEATKKGKTACKKHKHILLSHFSEEEIPKVTSLGFFTSEGIEKPIRNLGDYEEAMLKGPGFLIIR